MRVENIKRHSGIAGQFAVSVDVTYQGEDPMHVTFTGSVYGGPVVMDNGRHQVFVTDPGRFGEFGTEWVRRFYDDLTERGLAR